VSETEELKMKKLLILLPILVIASFTAGCIFSDDDKESSGGSNALLGTWKYEKYNSKGQLEQRESVMFNSNGTYKRSWLYMEYTPSGSSYVTEDYTEEGIYTVSGNIVTISFEGGDEAKRRAAKRKGPRNRGL
jgi:hypothetical protein